MKKHLFLFLIFLLGLTSISAQTTYYVMEESTGEGTSWSDPGDLQAMIVKAVAGDQIWVAAGTYQPISPLYFELKEGVKIYGGFSGVETQLSERDWIENESILKGTGTGNLVVRNYMNNLTSATLLDGFTITGANRASGDGGGIYNNTSSPSYNNCIVTGNIGNYGAGVFNKFSTSVFTNVTITNNTSAKSGAGMYNDNASPMLKNVIISNNTSSEFGGGMRNHMSSSPTLVNVLIKNNQSVKGAGIYNSGGSNPTLTNLTISGNIATSTVEGGAGIYNLDSSPLVKNTIIWGNIVTIGSVSVFDEASSVTSYSNCLIENGTVAGGIISNADPLFVDVSADNYNLQSGSPAINVGNNDFVTGINHDLANNLRIAGNLVDLGVFEFNSSTAIIDLKMNNARIIVYPNPIIEKLYIQSESTIQKVNLYDIVGHEIMQIIPNDNFINVSRLKTGTYLIKIETIKGCSTAKINKL